MAVRNATFGQVIRRDLYSNAITAGDLDEMLSHLAGYVCEHFVVVLQAYPVHGSRQNLCYDPVYFNAVLFWRHDLAPTIVPQAFCCKALGLKCLVSVGIARQQKYLSQRSQVLCCYFRPRRLRHCLKSGGKGALMRSDWLV